MGLPLIKFVFYSSCGPVFKNLFKTVSLEMLTNLVNYPKRRQCSQLIYYQIQKAASWSHKSSESHQYPYKRDSASVSDPDRFGWGLLDRSTALYFYKQLKTSLHKPRGNLLENLFSKKCAFKNTLQLLVKKFLSQTNTTPKNGILLSKMAHFQESSIFQ